MVGSFPEAGAKFESRDVVSKITENKPLARHLLSLSARLQHRNKDICRLSFTFCRSVLPSSTQSKILMSDSMLKFSAKQPTFYYYFQFFCLMSSCKFAASIAGFQIDSPLSLKWFAQNCCGLYLESLTKETAKKMLN